MKLSIHFSDKYYILYYILFLLIKWLLILFLFYYDYILFFKKTSHQILFQTHSYLNIIVELICLNTRLNGTSPISKLLTLNHLSLRKTLLRIHRSSPKSILNIDNPTGLKLLTRLRFSHNFSNWVNPWCFCSLETESLSLFFLQCHLFTNIRSTYLEEFTKINLNILNVCENSIVEVLL